MTHLLLNIDVGMIDWARAQFALTAIYHWLFVPLTLGLAVVMGIMETIYYRTGKVFWKDAAKFWQRLFGINFAMGWLQVSSWSLNLAPTGATILGSWVTFSVRR